VNTLPKARSCRSSRSSGGSGTFTVDAPMHAACFCVRQAVRQASAAHVDQQQRQGQSARSSIIV
jgi:hypothetical protein